MYTNTAYLGTPHEEYVDTTRPLMVTSAGYYKVHTSPIIRTERYNGWQDYQLLYVSAGKLHLHTNGTVKIINEGNMLLFRPDDPQVYYLYAKDKTETYWVHFTGSEVEEILEHHGMPKNNVIFAGSSQDYPWLFRQIIQELQLQRVNFNDLANINLQHIFLLMRRYLNESHDLKSETLHEMERAKHYFYENYTKNIVIEDYAKSRGMTANWFTQSFKKITKYTPMQYIISLRISHAMNLITGTDYNFTQVAAAVGYDNSMYFSRLFKKHTGMTPSEYKKSKKT